MADNSTADDEKSLDDDTQSLDEVLASASLISTGVDSAGDEHSHHDEDHFDDDEDLHEEVAGSLAAKVLTGLALLIVGGGIALWGGPKIAPSLPSGLDGVKAWLMPGDSGAAADLAALKQDFEARFATIPQSVSESETTKLVQDLVAEKIADISSNEEFQDKLNALSDQVVAMKNAGFTERLTGVETKLEGILSQLDSLGSLAESADGLSEDAVAQIGKFVATVDGLRGEIAGLAARDGTIEKRIEEVAASADRRISESEAELATTKNSAAADSAQATIQNSLSVISGALKSGAPYSNALEQLQTALGDNIPDALIQNAQTGVTSLASLKQDYSNAAYLAIRSDIQANSSASTLDRLSGFIGSQMASRSLTPQEGDDTDAVLSRAEEALRHDDLAGALHELSALEVEPAKAIADWVAGAQALADTISALEQISAPSQPVN